MRCSNCQKKRGKQVPGRCTNCGAGTHQAMCKLCTSCASKQNACEVCKNPLSAPGIGKGPNPGK